MTGIRAQARLETTSRIKQLAREQIASKGAADLSLREIARELGVASSALYRYFDSRDQLLTALIVESYDEVGELVEHADARCRRDDLLGRWKSVTTALRTWAIEHPSDYGLLFGTPVPDYEAPADTNIPGQRYTTVLMGIVADAHAAGRIADVEIPAGRAIAREYKKVRKNLSLEVPDEFLLAGLTAWAAMLGAISLEIFGHVDMVLDDPGVHFDSLTTMLGKRLLGL